MTNQPEKLYGNEVISTDNQKLLPHQTFKTNEFLAKLKPLMKNNVENTVNSKWIGEGVNCEVLSPNKAWRKGKVRLVLEFSPDEPEPPPDNVQPDTTDQSESPLDEIRHGMTEKQSN